VSWAASVPLAAAAAAAVAAAAGAPPRRVFVLVNHWAEANAGRRRHQPPTPPSLPHSGYNGRRRGTRTAQHDEADDALEDALMPTPARRP